MGISGLMSFLLQNRGQCTVTYDLVEEARQRGGIELLVDYFSFQLFLASRMFSGLTQAMGNQYLQMTGGEYDSMDKFLTKFVHDLQSLDIHLVWYVDGAKGSTPDSLQRKFETWRKRHMNSINQMQTLIDVCYGRRDIGTVGAGTFIRPVLLEVQFRETMKKCNSEVIQCPSGEADFVIAKDLHTRPKAFAIISNDSDFCIFPNSRFIPSELFDLENDLQFGVGLKTDKPLRLMAAMVTDSSICSLLQLSDCRQLAEVGIIAGNDFTSHVMRNVREHLGHRGCARLQDIVSFIQQYKFVDSHPYIKREMRHNRDLANCIAVSRQFYSLQQDIDLPIIKDALTEHIIAAIKSLDYPPNVLSMHANFHWHRTMLEEIGQGFPCSEVALTGLRTFIYRMLLPRQERTVTEYGRTSWQLFHKTTIYAADPHGLPAAHYINKEKIFPSLNLFHKILIHQEPDFQIKFFERYGRKNGFICYVLRYFLLLNIETNLMISYNEFMVAIAMVFSGQNESRDFWYQSLCVKPSARCVTIMSWLQNVYRHAYLFLAKLLYLSHEFPSPQEMFSSCAMWTAFYMVTMHQGPEIHHLSRQDQNRVQSDMQRIIKEKRHIIRYIVQGIFSFDDRF